MDPAGLFLFLHLLVFVYWLGGDLGAFYTSRFLIQPGITADRRLLAAKIVGDVDMAPRSALILTLPTGLSLAAARGWLELSPLISSVIWIVALFWLALAWSLHTRHGSAPQIWRHIDMAIRYLLILTLTGLALAALTGQFVMADFLALKCLVLAAAIGLGLAIRHVLKPLGPALAGLIGAQADAAQVQLAKTLNEARPLVMCIWALLITATLLGIFKPVLT